MNWEKKRLGDPVELYVEPDGSYTVKNVLGETMSYTPPPKLHIPPIQKPKPKVELEAEKHDLRESRYCRECGAYIPIGETVCLACGRDQESEDIQKVEIKVRKWDEEADTLIRADELYSGVIGFQTVDTEPILNIDELYVGRVAKVLIGDEIMRAHIYADRESYVPNAVRAGKREWVFNLHIREL